MKIGKSHDLRVRLSALRGAAGEVEVLAWFGGGYSDEREIHDLFAKERVEGEWFQPSRQLMRFVAVLARHCHRWVEDVDRDSDLVDRAIIRVGRSRSIETRAGKRLGVARHRQQPYRDWLQYRVVDGGPLNRYVAIADLAAVAMLRGAPLGPEEQGRNGQALLQWMVPLHDARDGGYRR